MEATTTVVAHTTEYEGENNNSMEAGEQHGTISAAAVVATATTGLVSGKEERQEFGNYVEFLLVSIGYCVGKYYFLSIAALLFGGKVTNYPLLIRNSFDTGLGNLIVYPGRVFAHGGGAFLVAYYFFLLVLGIPMYMHDLKIGKYR